MGIKLINDTAKKIEINLYCPNGNTMVLYATGRSLCKKLGMDENKVSKMLELPYIESLQLFNHLFGDLVDLTSTDVSLVAALSKNSRANTIRPQQCLRLSHLLPN